MISTDLTGLRRLVDKALSDRDHLKRTVEEETAALKELKEHTEAAAEAQNVIQTVASRVQVQATASIVALVNRCLKTVFGNDAIEFLIEFDRKRGKTEANLLFQRNGTKVNPLSSSAGGEIDVTAFALRVVLLLMATPKKRRLLILDEPFRAVHGKVYRERTAKLVEVLAEELGLQFIIVTGHDWMEVGKVIRMGESS